MNATEGNAIAQANAASDAIDTADQLDAIFAEAYALQVAERWQEAERLYRAILTAEASQPAVYYNMAMLKWQTKQPMASLMFFKQAIAGNAQEPTYWVSYVDALMQTGQQQYAREVLMRGLEQGIHGEAINALVDQLTAPETQKVSMVAPRIAVNSRPLASTVPHKLQTDVSKLQVPKSAALKLDAPKFDAPINKRHYPVNAPIKRALALLQAGKLQQAQTKFEQLLPYYPAHPDILAGLGSIAVQRGKLEVGITFLERSLKLVPQQTTVLSTLSIAYAQKNRDNEAIACCNRAIAINPHYAEAYVNRGNAQKALKQPTAAIESYQKAIALQPENADYHFNLGAVFRELKQYPEAEQAFRTGLVLAPQDVKALYEYGNILHVQKRYDAAIDSFNRGLALDGEQANTFMARGLSYLATKQFALAVDDFNQALARKPKSAEVHMNLAVVLHKLNRIDEAIAINQQALTLNTRYSGAYINHSQYLLEKQQYQPALGCLEQAIKLNEEVVMATWHKSTIYLLLGDFKQGWALYESRKAEFAYSLARQFAEPSWTGEQSLIGKTLLIYKEQGFGDNIQFCRYAYLAQSLGARVILETPKELVSLMQTLGDDITVVEYGAVLPAFDYQCSVMSMPLACKTMLETIPAYAQYLQPDKTKCQQWQARLGPKTKPRVGLAWTGSTWHNNDHTRSVALATMQTLFDLPFEFHSLQKEIRASDALVLAHYPSLVTHENALHDFTDTAALIANMDIVISVDTSVAHLAAAMGKPCWIMLSFAPEFRWLLDRADSPWYPSVRLFRQPSSGDWASVTAQIKRSLSQFFK